MTRAAKTGPDPGTIRAQLRRILASREFASAERMCRFLRLTVTEALAGRTDRLKEYVIGTEVFDRPASFDPGSDPIVRVEARRLRQKLRRYYEHEGLGDEIVIEIPKGSYAPVFRTDHSDRREVRTSTIAVLPFTNLGTSADDRHLSDGLTWELIHRLTRIKGLSVVAWTSANQVRTEPFEPQAIGAALRVANLLTCAIRRAGERLRVMVQLVDAGTGVYLWSETYDRELADVFAIQEDIAAAIVQTLQVRLGLAAAPRRTSGYRLEAYELYLRGRAAWNQRTEDSLRRSIEIFSEAAEVDPACALAYAGQADALALLADYGFSPPQEVMGASKTAALRALEIEPGLAEAHCSLAFVLSIYQWEWEQAGEHYRAALDLNPGYATAHHWYACDYLGMIGRLDDAFRELQIALRLDPLAAVIEEGRGYLLMLMRRYEEALASHTALTRAYPTFFKAHGSLGRTLIQLGRYQDALASLERARSLAGDVPSILGAMGQAYALAGDAEGARDVLGTLASVARERYVPATTLALVHVGLGEYDSALENLARGADNRELSLPAIYTHPAYDPLRGDRRFDALLRRMNLAR